ncbi:hypothetical protein C9374_012453 [Naegleria lovaniensis]|uniref:Uncharacterized protein n=1 Tax=Naegleria lovaniensis TaxID=51637 RepID=A0AA88H367_NAELO|nr:uncharacterized protein C9374_012453 [Naegleria lovaniensis]KAG2392201.1 hypothetical protein C9374_012453 [Naegleria lovaniensis]
MNHNSASSSSTPQQPSFLNPLVQQQQHALHHHRGSSSSAQSSSLATGRLFAFPATAASSTLNTSMDELNQYNQALNALQSIENQFDLNVEEFLNEDEVEDATTSSHSGVINNNHTNTPSGMNSNHHIVTAGGDAGAGLFFDNTSLYQASPQNASQASTPFGGPPTNNSQASTTHQLLQNAHNTVMQHNKLLQTYLNSMGQQVSARPNVSIQQQQGVPSQTNAQNVGMPRTSSFNQLTNLTLTSPPQPKVSSSLNAFDTLVPSFNGTKQSSSKPNSSNNPSASSNTAQQKSSSSSTSTTSSASSPSMQFFSTLDKGIHSVQQVIVNGGITSVQVWSNCLMQLIPILKVMDDTIPDTIIGGKSVSNRKKTPLNVSIEVSLDRFRMLVSTIINMMRQRNPLLEKEGAAFCQVSEKLSLIVNLEDLSSKIQRNEIAFSDDLWRADVSLLMSNQEQDKGLTRDKAKKKKNENLREGFSVFSNPENPATTVIQYAPIKAGVVSNNKKNCQLRYKLCYDNWLVYYVDSTKLFAINCGKNTKSKKKSSKSTEDETGKEDEEMDGASNDEQSPSSPQLPVTSSHPEKSSLSRSASTASLGSSVSSSAERPSTIAVASNGSFVVSPKSGSNAGGYFIFIQCTFDSRLITDLQEVKVFLGDQEAEIRQINQNAIFIVAPKTQMKGIVPIEIRTNNFTVSNPNDLKFEFLDENATSNILVDVNEKKRKFDACCDSVEVSSVNNTTNSNAFNPAIVSNCAPSSSTMPKEKKKKKRKEVLTPYRREWAIVIAIDKYHHNGLLHESSASSVHDAMNLANILTKIYGFEVRLLLNEEATWAKVNQLFVSLAESDSLQNDDAILIYFTGVSISKQYINGYTENYLALYDTDPDNLINTAISQQSFVNFHHRLSAKHILFVLDTFYNGIMMKVVNDGHPSKDMKYYATNKAVQMICASQRQTGMRPGIFSKELVNLLTTMKWGNDGIKSGHLTLTPFYTTSDLGKQLQLRVHKETNGVQVPRFGDIELGGGNFLFIPKSYEKHSYNSELERIVSLLSLYEDYIQNMNLGDMGKHESLMSLLKLKFFQISNYYLQTFETLIKEEKIQLRSDIYASQKLNLTEIIKTVRYSYLALYRWADDWILHNPYHLADANKKLLDSNPSAVVKRIFVVGLPNMSENDEKQYIKLMKYHHNCGIEVRVVQHKDLDDRKEIPHNFSILDSRLAHYLSFEDDYPKSVIIFNRKSVADLYYSKWVYVYNRSIPFSTYFAEKYPNEVVEDIQTDVEPIQCQSGCNLDHTSAQVTAPSSEQDKNMSLTDPLLSFDIHENIETLQICLDPLLQGFKKKFLEMINTPKDKHARHCGKCLLLQKFHSISMHYENQITTFFSKGEIVVHANFYDTMRLRLHDIQEYVERSYVGVIPIHAWRANNRATQSPYFTHETVLEIADMNKRLRERNSNIVLQSIFVFYKGLFGQNGEFSAGTLNENGVTKSTIIAGLKYHRDCGIDVLVTFLDHLEQVKEAVAGNFCIIDGKVCGSTTLSSEPSKCSGTHSYYVNSIDGGAENVKQKKELWNISNPMPCH